MNTKGNIERYFSVAVWGILLVLTIYIITKSCTLYSNAQTTNNVKSFCRDLLSDFGEHLLLDTAPIIQFSMGDSTYSEYNNDIVNMVRNTLVLDQYIFDNETSNAIGTTAYSLNNSVGGNVSSLEEDSSFVVDSTPEKDTPTTLKPSTEQVEIGYQGNDIYYEDDEALEDVILSEEATEALATNIKKIDILKKDKDLSYLLKNFYTVNSVTGVDKKTFQVSDLLATDLTLTKNSAQPQILIYHTHAHETFADSRKGEVDDTIVGVGRVLDKILTEKYGYNVIHHEAAYDANHRMAYSASLPNIEKILKDNPTIEVVLDLHRDAGTKKTIVNINGKDTAKIMFFNGVSRNNSGPIDYLYNPNLKTNLSFSLQMKLLSMQLYPEFTKRIFLKSYRYNMHLRGRYSLVEVGDNINTVSEVKNAMEPLAAILDQVLSTR